MNRVSFSLPHDQGLLTIREATLEDLDDLVRMNAAMAWETECRRLDLARLRAGTQAVLDSRDRGFYLLGVVRRAQEADRAVAQLLVTNEWSDWRNGNFWWIQSVYVEPQWRRLGIFRQLYRHLETMARSQPEVCGIRLYVERRNTNAQAIYSRLGLSPTGYHVFEKDLVLSSERA
ncbi:MAG: N-acetyltransferase [Nitrospirae bacterium]|nr:MAG: N-acetyltransferase [Nitrospirota bacterium]